MKKFGCPLSGSSNRLAILLLQVKFSDNDNSIQDGQDGGGLSTMALVGLLEQAVEKMPQAFEKGNDNPQALPISNSRRETLEPENLERVDMMLRAWGRCLCNFLFRKFVWPDNFRHDLFSRKLSLAVFECICSDVEDLKMVPDEALKLLADFDPGKAETYRKMLLYTEDEIKECYLTGSNFGQVGEASDHRVNTGNIRAMIVHSAHHLLFTSRSTSLTIVSHAFYDCLFQLQKQSKDSQDDYADALFTELHAVGGTNLAELMCGIHIQLDPLTVKNALVPIDWPEEHMPSFALLQGIVCRLEAKDLELFLKFVIASSACSCETRINVEPLVGLTWSPYPTSSTCDKILRWPVTNPEDPESATKMLQDVIRDVDVRGFERD